ncbi:sulfurtransferase [Desulfonema ishimotonii]|uniref:Sulfurtransferase n=1 Tax=Desulfonema ishimotonii TaxID=45657 RepID=A0A401FW30_9BACT|nr:DUF6691 family protein [Desulfonema ishimotonii]GBC61159.1 sulfurtransferase [Desulfonema ishimotonii]
MINTFFNSGSLDTPASFIVSLIIGIAFGAVLERAGFGSSRRLSGIFYFRDMAVLKVMFTAVIVSMLGISFAKAFGWVTVENVFFLNTIYAAQILGGLIFGVGFVMSGWCPGTGAVGLASGRIDALVFLIGAVIGGMVYNEAYPLMSKLQTPDQGILFVYDSLGVSEGSFGFVMILIALGCFWGAEYIEKNQGLDSQWGKKFLKIFSVVLIGGGVGLLAIPGNQANSGHDAVIPLSENKVLEDIHTGKDHIEPQELADRLIAGDQSIKLVDIRTAEEFNRFHLRSASNIQLVDLVKTLEPKKDKGLIILYSNGMTHPAQARDSMFRSGFNNVYFLTDGLEGFLNSCLKPVSLRSEPVPPLMATKINAWRAYFLEPVTSTANASKPPTSQEDVSSVPLNLPGIVDTEWLNENLEKPEIKIIDLRSQPEYNSGHIPGSLSLNLESFRGLVQGNPSCLLPQSMLSDHFSMMGISPDDMLVIVCTEKFQDATLIGMACERLQHERYAILRGGFPKWKTENRPQNTILPQVTPSKYPVPNQPDTFTAEAGDVLALIGKPRSIIIDVRPEDYFTGKKKDEARGGHIPGAINLPFSEDIEKFESFSAFKPVNDLENRYKKVSLDKATPIIVHCRTGHQASQTYFILVRLLGYTNIKWYDAGWTEWAAKQQLPVE